MRVSRPEHSIRQLELGDDPQRPDRRAHHRDHRALVGFLDLDVHVTRLPHKQKIRQKRTECNSSFDIGQYS